MPKATTKRTFLRGTLRHVAYERAMRSGVPRDDDLISLPEVSDDNDEAAPATLEKPEAKQRTDTLATPRRMAFTDEERDGDQGRDALRDFDMDEKYGPCVGLSRLQRWRRAERWDLAPPVRVLRILETLDNADARHECLWSKLGF